MTIIDRYMQNKEPDSKVEIKYFSSKMSNGDPTINAYILINGEMYRVRSELLVFNKERNKIYAIKLNEINQYGIKAILPGGSAEPRKTLKEQAIIETKEECEILVKNVFYSGARIVKKYAKYPKWQKELLWPLGYKYEGHCTFVFVGEFDRKIERMVGGTEWDHASAKRFKFYNPEELGLDKERIDIINKYR